MSKTPSRNPEILAAASLLLGVSPTALGEALRSVADQQTVEPRPELLTPNEFSREAKLHLVTTRRLLREGRLPGVKIAGRWRIPATALEGGAGV